MDRLSALVAISVACLQVVGCNKEDDSAKRENERLRAEMATLKAQKATDEAAMAKDENERLKAELAAAQARTTSGPAASIPATTPSEKTGKKIVDEYRKLKEGEQVLWQIPPGRYRVRATSSNSGVKVKWVGARCTSSKEVKVYDEVCSVSDDAQLVVENPAGLTGLGPTEQVAVSITTM